MVRRGYAMGEGVESVGRDGGGDDCLHDFSRCPACTSSAEPRNRPAGPSAVIVTTTRYITFAFGKLSQTKQQSQSNAQCWHSDAT
jgi:hypothetical protein